MTEFDNTKCLKMLNELKKNRSKSDCDLIDKAFCFAYKYHYNKFRKSGEPYIEHPLRTSLILSVFDESNSIQPKNNYMEVNMVCAAILHDVIEDTPATYEDIKETFNEDIASLVLGVTKEEKPEKVNIKDVMQLDDNNDKFHFILNRITINVTFLSSSLLSFFKQDVSNYKSLSNHMNDYKKSIQKTQTLCSLFQDINKDVRILQLKLADRLDNMNTLKGHNDEKIQRRIAKETLEIYAPIAELLGMNHIQKLLEDLCFEQLYPKEYMSIEQLEQDKYSSNNDYVKCASMFCYSKDIYNLLKENGVSVVSVNYRFKNKYGIYKQLLKGKICDEIPDLSVGKIVVENTKDLYKAYEVISRYFPTNNLDGFELKDYVSSPKANGYQALHSNHIFHINNSTFNFQIHFQTKSMYNKSYYGISSLYLDKYNDYKKALNEEIKKNSSYNNICNLCKEYEEGLISYIDFYKYFKMINLSEKIQIIIPGSNYKLTYKDCTLDKFLKYGMSDANFDEIYINGKKIPKKKFSKYVLKHNDRLEFNKDKVRVR